MDNQIRQKLWHPSLPPEIVAQMARLVLSASRWDYVPLSTRFTFGAKGSALEREALSGHLGEWFTLAAGAYCALGPRKESELKTLRSELFAAIGDQVNRHSEIFGSLWRAQDGVGCLKASASIAHNFGDLDRVMDMWELDVGDPLRLEFYKLGALPFDSNRKLRHQGRLWVAGELYKSKIMGSSMALENHRHYALRKPKVLRTDPAFRVPTGPFFDEWGWAVGRCLTRERKHAELAEVVEVLIEGWERQPTSFGYGRGLRGISDWVKGADLASFSSQKDRQKALALPQDRFERIWGEAALAHMDEIPSRAR